MSSWKLTKKLKETHFLRGRSSSSSQNNQAIQSTETSRTSQDSSKKDSYPSTPTSPTSSNNNLSNNTLVNDSSNGHALSPSSTSSAAGSAARSTNATGRAASRDTIVSGSRANTLTAETRGTITSHSSQPGNGPLGSQSPNITQSSGGAAGDSTYTKPSGSKVTSAQISPTKQQASSLSSSSSSSGVASGVAALLRVKIYELRNLVVQQYRSGLPAWAFEKSSTKPPPVYLVLEYDKTQILLHAIGGTVEEPVWDKTTAFDVVSGDVPLNVSLYIRTRDVPRKDIQNVDDSNNKDSTAKPNVELAKGDPSNVSLSNSSINSTVPGGNRGSTSASSNNPNPGYSSDDRLVDILLASTRVNPSNFRKHDQLNVGGGLLNIKCELQNTRNHGLSIDDFTLLKVVGKGSFGKVMQVRKNDTHQIYALKTIKKAHIVSKSEVGHTLAERSVLAKINNPFIVPLKFSFQSPEKLYLVLAFVNGGELFHHLQREWRFDLNRARFYTAELLCALECLHEYNVIYRDLKPENILLDYTGHIALCDFGLCKLNMGSKDQTSTFCGTPEYLAPELLLGHGYTKAVDWWTLGVLFYEMLTGLPPFYDQNTNTMYHKIVKDPLTFPADMDREAKSLITGLLERDPSRRLGANGAAEIKAHSFFHQIDWKYLLNKKYAAPFLPPVASAVDTSNFDSEFTSETPMDSVVDKEFHLSDSVQKQFGGWSYSNESKLASSGKW